MVSTKFNTVLVTGANSFYAAAVMDRLVKDNVTIHAAVRTERSAGPLRERYGALIKVFIVPDYTVAGAFDTAVQGCDGVFHIASPLTYIINNAKEDYLDPAINGVLSLMNAAASEPKVKRVVMTSSIAAVVNPVHPDGYPRPGYRYTEADWNPLTYDDVVNETAFFMVYPATKAIAERTAWKFVDDEKRHFDLVVINPVQTFGHYTQHVASPKDMNYTNSELSRLMDGEQKELPRADMPWIVDIDSVADAHISALKTPSASGRYIIASELLDFQQIVDIMHENFPDADWIKNVLRGNPGTKQVEAFWSVDRSKSERELGIKYPPAAKAVIDFCKKYQEDRKKWVK